MAKSEKVNIDTTVQEKNITYPTDAKLRHKMIVRLADAAQDRSIKLRQSYRRLAKKALQNASRPNGKKKDVLKHAKRLKTMLGRVKRDIERKVPIDAMDAELGELLIQAERLLAQEKTSKNKLYSLHEPAVECIAKGKAHKKYEFGNKVSFVSSSRSNWILGVMSFHGNPYDGDTMKPAISQAERLTGMSINDIYTDRGYRGRKRTVPDQTQHIVGERRQKKLSKNDRRWHKRRNAIEPIIGHVKSDHRMSRNFLSGVFGDDINAILSGCGFNFRKLLRAFFLPIFNGEFVEIFVQLWQDIRRKYLADSYGRELDEIRIGFAT